LREDQPSRVETSRPGLPGRYDWRRRSTSSIFALSTATFSLSAANSRSRISRRPRSCLNASECLGDRLVFLLQWLQTSIELIKVTEQIASQFDELSMQALEAPIHGLEALVDHFEALAQEGDEVLILGRRHAASSTPEERYPSSVSFGRQSQAARPALPRLCSPVDLLNGRTDWAGVR
jgi:hypothetical protein